MRTEERENNNPSEGNWERESWQKRKRFTPAGASQRLCGAVEVEGNFVSASPFTGAL